MKITQCKKMVESLVQTRISMNEFKYLLNIVKGLEWPSNTIPCPLCNGSGSYYADWGYVDGNQSCEQCLEMGVINEDGTCLEHPPYRKPNVGFDAMVNTPVQRKYNSDHTCKFCNLKASENS